MAQTELLNSISKSIDYPVEQNLSASYHCGTFSLIVDTDLWTEQMYYELPWIQLDIYITVGGIDIKYLSCNIMLDTDEPKKPYSVSVYEIPGSFKVKLTPGFDDNVITTHNELCLQEDISNTWGPQTLEFPCSVVWDDSNISSSSGGGGGGGGSVTPADLCTYTIIRSTDSNYAAIYKLQQTKNSISTFVGDTINIPKDMVIQSGTVETCEHNDVPIIGYVVGDKYLDLIISNSSNEHIYILLNDLVDLSASNISYNNSNSGLDSTNVNNAIDELSSKKVDKEIGKVLSSNDYTTAEKNKLAAITNPIKLKGRVDSISDLPADAETGWLYFVGIAETVDKEEYVYTEEGTWEHIGTAEVDLSNYYTKSEVNTAISNKADSTALTAHTGNADIHVTAADKTAWNGALISKADTTTVNTMLDLKANLTDLDEIDNKTVFIGGVEPTRTSALWIQNNVTITGTEFIDMPQTNYINITAMSIVNQPDGNYGILYVPIESNAKYRICKQVGHTFRAGTTTSIPQTGTTVNYTTANHTGDQITITTGNTDKYLVIVYWYYTSDPGTTKEQMRATITVSKIGNTQIHYLDNGNYLPLITSDTAIKSQPRNLIGKNILFIGDSITEKNYRTAKNYHDYLAEWFGFENINKGVSGTGYMDNETFGLGWYNKLLNGFYPSTGVDGIVIMGAINDRYHSVGTYGDSTATTLFGTLKLMYEELITRYPKIPILIITSTPRRYSYGDSGNDGTLANYHGHVDAVIQMAKEYSFPCFDLYRNSGLRPWNATNNTEYFTADGTGVETGPRDADGVHPNSKGHKIMAQKLFEFINSGLNL